MDSKRKTTEAEPARRPPEAASAAQISAVLGNDDILREILLRLDFPTCLVRAAAVSKRWLRHASDPAFLRRFRSLHPPCLLGFYLKSRPFRLRFIPLPQPLELAAVIRRGKFDLRRDARDVLDCHNGRLIVCMVHRDGYRPSQTTVCRPLHPGRGVGAIAQITNWDYYDGGDTFFLFFSDTLFHDDGGDNMAISVAVMCDELQARVARVHLQDFQAGDWGQARKSDLIQLPGQWKGCKHNALLAHGKIYLICMAQYILGIDVQSLSSFSIKLPNGVEFEYDTNVALSRAKGSGFCFVHVKMFQISVWHYTLDHSSTGNWKLVDIVSLPQVFGPNADPTWFSQGADVRVRVAVVGDNADFVFLMIQQKVFYLHISSRTVEKVYELAQDESLLRISPFMMVWPPTFPTLIGGHDNDE